MLASEERVLLLHAAALYPSDGHAGSWTSMFDNTGLAERAMEHYITSNT